MVPGGPGVVPGRFPAVPCPAPGGSRRSRWSRQSRAQPGAPAGALGAGPGAVPRVVPAVPCPARGVPGGPGAVPGGPGQSPVVPVVPAVPCPARGVPGGPRAVPGGPGGPGRPVPSPLPPQVPSVQVPVVPGRFPGGSRWSPVVPAVPCPARCPRRCPRCGSRWSRGGSQWSRRSRAQPGGFPVVPGGSRWSRGGSRWSRGVPGGPGRPVPSPGGSRWSRRSRAQPAAPAGALGAGHGAGTPGPGERGGGAARAGTRRAQEEEAAAGSDAEVAVDPPGQRLQHRPGEGPGRAHAGHDRHGLLALAALQALQLLGAGAGAGLRAPAPPAQGALRAAPRLPGDGLLGDAHAELRGELLLELRRAVPAAAAPGARPARHLLPAGPRRSPPVAPGLLGQGEEGALAGRLRLPRVQVRVEGGGGAEEPAQDPHDVGQRPRPLPAGTAGEIHPGEIFLHRPRVPQREPGRHAPGRVPPGGGRGGRPGAQPGPPPGHPAPVLHQAGNLPAAFQTRLQSLHRAQHGGVQLPRGAEEVGGGWKLGGLPPRAAAAHGAPRERLRHRLGALAGATHHDQIRHLQHPRAHGAPRQPADGLRQPPVPPGRVTPPGVPSFILGRGPITGGSPLQINPPPPTRPAMSLCVCAGEGNACWGSLLLPHGFARRWRS